MKTKKVETEAIEMNEVDNDNVQADNDNDNDNDNVQADNDNDNDNVQADNLTEVEIKAAQILRLKMPNLQDAGLNFEKRTGNFFRATLVKQTDNSGNPLYGGDGKQLEKVCRLVVDLADENGEPTAEAVKCADEIQIKRAAGFVSRFSTLEEKADAAIKEAELVLEATRVAKGLLVEEYVAATEVVNDYEMPEKVTAERVAKTAVLTARVNDQANAIAQLRAKLIAAGIDPDA